MIIPAAESTKIISHFQRKGSFRSFLINYTVDVEGRKNLVP